MSVVYLLSSSNTLIPLEVIQLQNTLLNMTTSSQEYFLGQNRLYYYAVSDELLLVLENTQLNQQIINNYTIDYDSTRLFSLKFTARSGGAQELGIQEVLYALGSSLTIIDLNQINGLTYATAGFSRGALLVGNDFNENEVLVFDSNNKIKSSNKTINTLVDTSTNQTIAGAKTFAGTIGLTFVSAPAGTDSNNLITRNQTTGILQQSATTNDKLVLTDTEQSISGVKTFTGNVKLQNLNTNTGTISKVLVKNPATNQIEEASVGSVVGSTSTATPITINNIVNNIFKLKYEEFPYTPLLNGLGATLNQGSYNLIRFDYATNTGLSNSTLALENTGYKVAVVDTGLYEFTFTFGFIHSPPTFTLTKGSGEVSVELSIDNTMVDIRYLYVAAQDYRNHTVVFYYRNLSNAAPKQADIRVFHNISATTQIDGDTDILAYPVLSSATTFLSVINYGTQTRAIDIINDTTTTNALLLTKADGSIVKNNNLTPSTVALKSEIPSLTNYATLDTAQTVSGTKTFQANNLKLNPITTAAATTNKLITRKQVDGALEETNVAVSNLALQSDLSNYTTLSSTQTVSGAKTFQANTLVLNPITTAASTNNKLITRNQTSNVVEETNVAVSSLALQSDLSNYTTLNTAQTISGAKTFQADKMILNPITTAAATTNKLLTRNQTTNVVEETNIPVSAISTSSLVYNANTGGGQTVSVFSGVEANVWYTVYVVPNPSAVNWQTGSGTFLCCWVYSSNESKSHIVTLTPTLTNFKTPTLSMSSSNIFISNPDGNPYYIRVYVKKNYTY